MKKSSITVIRIIFISLSLALIAMVVIRLKYNKETVMKRVYNYDKEQPIHVQADTVLFTDIGIENIFTGAFEPNKETKISAETQGKVDAVYVDVGSVVQKGQALIQLDCALLKLQLQSVEVQIEGIEVDVKRFSILADADAIQRVQLEKAEFQLKSSKVQKANILEQIAKSTIRAPFQGIVTAKLTEEGGFASPGNPLLQITDISLLRFIVNVSENDLIKFRLHTVHSITVDALPEIILSGKTTMIGSKANIGSSYQVQFSVHNTPGLTIKSGMFGKLKITEQNNEKRIVIPASAIVGSADHPKVYLVKNGIAVLRDITIVKRILNKAVIENGLYEGDVIITNGFINLFEKANVIVN